MNLSGNLHSVVLSSLCVAGVVCSLTLSVRAQDTIGNVFERQYRERIEQESLYGVYIPKDLGDVFSQLEQLTSREARNSYRNAKEREAVRKLHFSLGRWMIYNWGFYEGSRLTRYLNRYGVSHPDDMARFLMTCWHRYLNKKELDIPTLVEELRQIRSLLNPGGGWKRDTIR